MSALEMFPETLATDDKNRRYTDAVFMEWIRGKAEVEAWDLDVAADAESHWAPRWFSIDHNDGSAGLDGLAQSWLPPSRRAREWWMRIWRIYDNPPFDDLGAWFAKTWATIEEANYYGLELRIGMVLPGNRHEQPFWQEHVEPFRDGRAERFGYRLECHFPPGRQAYAKPGSNGQPVGSADFPSCLLVWRRA